MDQRQKTRDILFRMEMARKRRMHPIWGTLGLIAGQPRVLSELCYNENITQKELAELSSLEPATLSRSLDRLEEMGYILRNGNPDCRRSFLITLTEKGKQMADCVWKEFGDLENLMFAGFSEDEMTQLHSYIERIYGNLNAADQDA